MMKDSHCEFVEHGACKSLDHLFRVAIVFQPETRYGNPLVKTAEESEALCRELQTDLLHGSLQRFINGRALQRLEEPPDKVERHLFSQRQRDGGFGVKALHEMPEDRAVARLRSDRKTSHAQDFDIPRAGAFGDGHLTRERSKRPPHRSSKKLDEPPLPCELVSARHG